LSVVTLLRPAAVLWDLDGTLVDTEPYWMASETELVNSFGKEWSAEDALRLVGSSLYHSARILQAHGVDLAEEQIIDRLTGMVIDRVAVEVPWRPGSRELLLELNGLGVPAALVTMSLRRMAEPIVAALGFEGFAAIVGGDEVTHGKPHPEPYELGAAALGVSPADCVAIEDSAPGVASAVAAGAVVIAVPLHVSLTDDPSYELWDGLHERTAADVFSAFSARRSA
jgi:beta-phosphoglucomutase-like phosphatase (HAD superfamily)